MITLLKEDKQTVVHQLGNSVPPQFARILALSILDQVFGVRLPFFEILPMPQDYQLGFRKRKNELTPIYAEKAACALLNTSSHKTTHSLKIKGTEFFANPGLTNTH